MLRPRRTASGSGGFLTTPPPRPDTQALFPPPPAETVQRVRQPLLGAHFAASLPCSCDFCFSSAAADSGVADPAASDSAAPDAPAPGSAAPASASASAASPRHGTTRWISVIRLPTATIHRAIGSRYWMPGTPNL